MNLLERVLTLLRANLNTIVENSDDPESVLKQIQLDMRNQLVQVKTEIAKAIADGHVLQKHAQAKKAEADQWLQKAKQAVQQGNDDSARQALRHYNDINMLIQRYQQQKHDQEQAVETLRSVLRRLEARMVEVDTTLELLATQKRTALIQQRVQDALRKTGNTGRIQHAITEAGIHTHTTMHGAQKQAAFKTPDQSELLNPEQGIEQQLQELKDGQTESILPAPHQIQRTPHTGPLVNPSSEGIEQSLEMTKKQERRLNRRTPTSDDISTDRDLDSAYLKQLLDIPQNQE